MEQRSDLTLRKVVYMYVENMPTFIGGIDAINKINLEKPIFLSV